MGNIFSSWQVELFYLIIGTASIFLLMWLLLDTKEMREAQEGFGWRYVGKTVLLLFVSLFVMIFMIYCFVWIMETHPHGGPDL